MEYSIYSSCKQERKGVKNEHLQQEIKKNNDSNTCRNTSISYGCTIFSVSCVMPIS